MGVGRDRYGGDNVNRCLDNDGGYPDSVYLDDGMIWDDEETTTGAMYSGKLDVVNVSRRDTSL